MAEPYAAGLQDIRLAARRIAPHIVKTPVWHNEEVDARTGLSVFFKCELLQRTGAFKYRGACNAVQSLPDDVAAKGVATHSSGNHAAAVSMAAKVRGIPAHIVLPSNTPKCKVEAVKSSGGLITMCEPGMDAREAACKKVLEDTGASFIPPYNHPDIIAGQGTIALELLEQVPDLDAIVVPISGGGMTSGIAIAAHSLASSSQRLQSQGLPHSHKPEIKIVAAEPTGRQGTAADVALSKATGQLQLGCERPDTIADGLQGRLGDLTWPVVRDLVAGVVTLSEAEIVGAMREVFEHLKLVVEPSGACGLAAVLSPQFEEIRKPGGVLEGCQKVGVILCGGNIDLEALGLWDALMRQV